MKRLILACAFILATAAVADAGGLVNVGVGRGLLFGPRVNVGVGRVGVVRQPVFFNRGFAVHNRAFVGIPSYGVGVSTFGLGYNVNTFAVPSYGVQTFAAPGVGCGNSLMLGFGY